MLRIEETIAPVPEQTAIVANAAFPKGNIYLVTFITIETLPISTSAKDNRDGVLGDRPPRFLE